MARYIDADKLTNEIDEWLDSVGNVLIGKGMSYYGELLGCIEDTPTADVVGVKRGYWKEVNQIGRGSRHIQYTTKQCSVCGYWNGRKKTNYCSECGAKMDNERKCDK
jgi:hypothetical protein